MQFIRPTWPAPENVCALTTTRQQGTSLNSFSSFNLAHHVGDDPAHVANNRQLLVNSLKLAKEPIWLNQEHSNHIISLTSESKLVYPSADAVTTSHCNVVCGVMTADCLPILICNKSGTEVAAIHAGWRGLAKGIIENTLRTLNSQPTELLAWLGPAIGPRNFEVSDDVFDIFVDADQGMSDCFLKKENTPGKWLANIYLLAKHRLNRLGVDMVYGGDYCTFDDDKNFYSYRRDHGITGRMATLIWLSA